MSIPDAQKLSVHALHCAAEIHPGQDLSPLILESLSSLGLTLMDGDVLIVTHKVISKAEGRVYKLSDVQVSEDAYRYAELTGKDARLLQLILNDSSEVLRAGQGIPFITRHKLGFIAANACIDQSNAGGDERAIALPHDPDKSAADIRSRLESQFNVSLAVVVSDTHGRPFRNGSIGVAIGLSGMSGLKSFIGRQDRDGRTLNVSIDAQADLLASAAMLVMGQGSESIPFCLIRGYHYEAVQGDHMELIRKPESDLFAR